MYVCWKLLVVFCLPQRVFEWQKGFSLKISPEIIVCHFEAVRQPTGAFQPTEIKKENEITN